MLRTTDYCKEFKNGNILIKLDNGNILIKLDKAAIEKMKKDELLFLSDILWWIDCGFIGETFNMSNYETGHMIYNCYADLVYLFPWSYLEDLKAGKAVKLYTRKPDETDREIIEREYA